MKNLILGATCLLLAVQVHAQQRPPTPPVVVAPSVEVNTNKSVTVTTNHRFHVEPRIKVEGRSNVNGKVTRYSYSGATADQTQDQSDDPMKAKTFSKSFNLDRNDKVSLNNSYGSITIKIWDKNEIKIDADIKAYANTEQEAQKLLDDVSVNATKSGDLVAYKTDMDEHNGRWGRSIRNGKTIWRREVKVYVTVYMPKNNALNVTQEYGNITMDDFNGPTSIKIAYGKLNAGNLNNTNNFIAAEYSSASFGNINQAKIKQEYGSGLTIGTIGTLDLNSEYTAININTIKNSAVIRHEYGGGINIAKANNLTLDAHFVRIKINTITGTLTSRLEHGGLSVDNVETSARNVIINSEYSPVSLGFDQNYHANFTVDTDYAPFKYGTSVFAKKLGDDKSYTSKNYNGQIGKGGTNAVTVKAEYGSVTFK